ncbi:RNA polymerase sigma factor [Ferruginibacter sp.]|uniref:RNA polymerase sigma factor n=1 Tax=Ferruginibacter sp. TaxID=1940288 RepID=UPI00265845AE|nr:sigma-70 family RNA polymerase sigma factor [Ferruginibacter sp.]
MSQDELYIHIAGCRLNDRCSQEAIYKHFYKDMFVTCKRYAEDPHDALTILNDGFLKAFTNILKYSAELGDFKPWLKTIIINTAIDHTRNRKKGTQVIHIDNIQEQGNDDFQLNFNHSMEEVAQHLKALPSVTRIVINLFAFDGYDYKEIAEKLGISESTSRWHVSEARKKLKQSMQFKLSKEHRI